MEADKDVDTCCGCDINEHKSIYLKRDKSVTKEEAVLEEKGSFTRTVGY